MTKREAKPSPAAAVSDGHPSFAHAFPADAALDLLVRAFADGDYARVRRDAPALIATSEDPKVKDAAALLVRRTEADPLAVVLFALTGALLVLLTAWWLLHDGPPQH